MDEINRTSDGNSVHGNDDPAAGFDRDQTNILPFSSRRNGTSPQPTSDPVPVDSIDRQSSDVDRAPGGLTAVGSGTAHRDSILDRLLDEAISLAEDARSYLVTSQSTHTQQPASSADRLEHSVEIGRVTTCVGSVISWILARKAVLAGELSVDDGLDKKWRIDPSMAMSFRPNAVVPKELRAISTRASCLFHRVSRLDEGLTVDNNSPISSPSPGQGSDLGPIG